MNWSVRSFSSVNIRLNLGTEKMCTLMESFEEEGNVMYMCEKKVIGWTGHLGSGGGSRSKEVGA